MIYLSVALGLSTRQNPCLCNQPLYAVVTFEQIMQFYSFYTSSLNHNSVRREALSFTDIDCLKKNCICKFWVLAVGRLLNWAFFPRALWISCLHWNNTTYIDLEQLSTNFLLILGRLSKCHKHHKQRLFTIFWAADFYPHINMQQRFPRISPAIRDWGPNSWWFSVNHQNF